MSRDCPHEEGRGTRWWNPAGLLDLVLPRCCLGCGAAGGGLCAQCATPRPGARYLRGVGVVRYSAGYAGAVGTAVVHYKDRGRRDLLGPLSALLIDAVRQAESADLGDRRAGPVMVPVPSSARAARDRNGDHMLRLAHRAGRVLGLPCRAILYVARPVGDSVGLGARERADNLRGAFAARSHGPPFVDGGVDAGDRTILLVDDIVTTGSSLREAARALGAGGYRVGGAAVIAATPRRR